MTDLLQKKCNEKIESITGSSNVLMTTSGTSALEMAALLADIKEGEGVEYRDMFDHFHDRSEDKIVAKGEWHNGVFLSGTAYNDVFKLIDETKLSVNTNDENLPYVPEMFMYSYEYDESSFEDYYVADLKCIVGEYEVIEDTKSTLKDYIEMRDSKYAKCFEN